MNEKEKAGVSGWTRGEKGDGGPCWDQGMPRLALLQLPRGLSVNLSICCHMKLPISLSQLNSIQFN